MKKPDALTPTGRRVLLTAASRPDGNVCPTHGLRNAIQDAVIKKLSRGGFIMKSGLVWIITDAGRAAAHEGES